MDMALNIKKSTNKTISFFLFEHEDDHEEQKSILSTFRQRFYSHKFEVNDCVPPTLAARIDIVNFILSQLLYLKQVLLDLAVVEL